MTGGGGWLESEILDAHSLGQTSIVPVDGDQEGAVVKAVQYLDLALGGWEAIGVTASDLGMVG